MNDILLVHGCYFLWIKHISCSIVSVNILNVVDSIIINTINNVNTSINSKCSTWNIITEIFDKKLNVLMSNLGEKRPTRIILSVYLIMEWMVHTNHNEWRKHKQRQ